MEYGGSNAVWLPSLCLERTCKLLPLLPWNLRPWCCEEMQGHTETDSQPLQPSRPFSLTPQLIEASGEGWARTAQDCPVNTSNCWSFKSLWFRLVCYAQQITDAGVENITEICRRTYHCLFKDYSFDCGSSNCKTLFHWSICMLFVSAKITLSVLEPCYIFSLLKNLKLKSFYALSLTQRINATRNFDSNKFVLI